MTLERVLVFKTMEQDSVSRRGLPLFIVIVVFCRPVSASAQDMVSALQRSWDSLAPSEVMLFAVFAGAFSFALLAANWLIRERRRIEFEHADLAAKHADLKARLERDEALLDVPDQRVILWTGLEEEPLLRGTLPLASGIPEKDSEFVAFDTWMATDTIRPFVNALDRLQRKAESFDLSVETKNGSAIEAQGRASGSYAFVRFIALSGDRAALASLENEHAKLLLTTETMHTLFETANMPIWIRNAEKRLEWVNDAYAYAVGADGISDALENDLTLLDANERELIKSHHRAERGKIFKKVSLYKGRLPATIAGNRSIVEIAEIQFSSGSAGLAIDMSEIEDVQANLRRTTESHAQMINQLATGVAIFDSTRRLQFYNHAFQFLWQLEASALEDGPDNAAVFNMLRAEGKLAEQPDFAKWRNELLEVYEATGPCEHWWHLPDGRTLRVVASPQSQGGVVWVFENVTERLELESRNIELTRVQGETLDHLVEAIAVFGPDGRLKLSNPAFQSMWDLDTELVAEGTSLDEILNAARPLTAEEEEWNTIATAVTGVLDARQRMSGRMKTMAGNSLDYALVPLPNGQSMLAFVDVSANVKMELALLERNEALKAAEQLKNAFIEHVSYELRAPLTNIMGFAEMLSSGVAGALNGKQSEYVGDIIASSGVLHRLVDNILDLATVDAGIMELDLQEIDVAQTVQEAVKSASGFMKEGNLTMKMHLPANLGSFVGDAVRIKQVIFNLLSNAARFSPPNSDVILACQADKDSVTIRVADEGPGVPEEHRTTIFERFEAKTSGASRGGAGLGLAIAKSFVDLHGGTIAIDEEVEQGAAFICRFPRRPVETAVAAQ